jgi:hypothetical protein
MAYYRFQLKAGVPFRTTVSGRVILIDDLGGASGLDITPNYGGRDLPNMPDRKKAFKFMEPFDSVTLTAPVDCNVGLFLSSSDVSLGFADGSLVNVSGQVTIANGAGARVPVDVAGANVQVTATNVGNQALNTILDLAAKNVGTVAVSVSNDATLRRLRFRNTTADATIALGGAGVTIATSPIILGPGQSYFEEDAAGANWYAISDKANATLNVQGLKP